MKKIYKITDSLILQTTLQNQQQVVLVGGCFDILHLGHLKFLQAAKQEGDSLAVLLESDNTIRKAKGSNRPINAQSDRAELLAALEIVDVVILLPEHMTDEEYDRLVFMIKPAIIATTAGDTHRVHKERQAKQVGAQVQDVVKPIANKSTSRVVALLHNEL